MNARNLVEQTHPKKNEPQTDLVEGGGVGGGQRGESRFERRWKVVRRQIREPSVDHLVWIKKSEISKLLLDF